MNRLFSLLIGGLVALGVASCQETETAVNLKDEISKVEIILEKYVMANENKDFSLIEQIWATDEDIVLIGTDSDEQFVGWEEIRPAIQHQFAEFEDTYISILDQMINISEEGNTAWFSQFINYNFIYKGQARSFKGIRYTGVMVKRDGTWKMVQSHLSIPVKEGTELGVE